MTDDGDGDDGGVDGDREQRRAVRDGYGALADEYGKSRDPPEVPLVESFLAELSDGSRLLDVGCGQGTPVLDRLPAGDDAVGIDFSTEQLRHARTATDAALVRADMTSLPVVDAGVDAVTALHSLVHVPVRQHPTVLAEFARVTRPGARLLLTAGGTPGRARTTTGWRVASGWSGRSPASRPPADRSRRPASPSRMSGSSATSWPRTTTMPGGCS